MRQRGPVSDRPASLTEVTGTLVFLTQQVVVLRSAAGPDGCLSFPVTVSLFSLFAR